MESDTLLHTNDPGTVMATKNVATVATGATPLKKVSMLSKTTIDNQTYYIGLFL
jgi:hypothetical protein